MTPTVLQAAPPEAQGRREFMKFRVEVGTHIQRDPRVPRGTGQDGTPETIASWNKRAETLHTRESGVFESDQDLTTLNGQGGMIPKFTRIFDDQPNSVRPGQLVWDSSKETLAEFNARAQASLGAGVGANPPPGAVLPPHNVSGKPQAAQPPIPGVPTPVTQGGATPNAVTFDSMSVDELKKFAQEEGINLGGAKDKAQIINKLRAAGLPA